MNKDLNLIEQLRVLLDQKGREIFIKTDLSLIVPDGALGYSTNSNNEITGVKIAGLKAQSNEALKIISNFKMLERLVFYSDISIELPIEIANLNNLKYISLLGFVAFPKELFTKGLPLYVGQYGEVKKTFSTSANKALKRWELFKMDNPNIKVKLTSGDLVSRTAIRNKLKQFKMSPGLEMEIELFCLLTDNSRLKSLVNHGIFISGVGIEQIKDPPYEIFEQGQDAILKYFSEKDIQGIERLYEAKIVIVGAGESGKTTLIRKLQNPSHPVPNAEDKRTEGIRVTTYPFSGVTRFGIKEIQANIWDFGGQELYHTTHQLFLTPDTLYILLNDNRKNDTDFYYWLNIVTIRAGGNSPILMIFNAKDNAARQIIPGKEIYTTFPNLLNGSIDVNFADKDIDAIQQMKQKIEQHFTSLEVLGKPFPAYWVKVREALAKLPEEHIGWAKFLEICEQNGINDVSQAKILAATLHNLGVLLYFPEVFGLDDLIILKSQWCVDAIYSALDAKNIINNGGRFNEKMLAEKWSDNRFAGNQLQLLRLMQHFDLCYKIDNTHDYIAPQLLPIEENQISHTIPNWSIVFQFDYIFMPAGLVTRLIARMSFYIKSPYVWRGGVVLEWESGTIAEIVEHLLTHKIVIKINGTERKRRLVDIRKCLYDLQSDFKGLKFKEGISCNCADCLKGGETTIYELKALEDDAEHNDEVVCRNGTRKKISAKNILDGISYEDKPRVFISYSHRNENFKDEFRTMISPMEKEGRWRVWDDRWLLPGDSWNKEIIKHLNEANVIVLMLTADFFKSSFIYDIELARAIQRHETGEAVVIGIVVSDCMWEETPLAKIQMLPKDGIPVERSDHRNEVWKIVANKIKETILVRQGKNNRTGGWLIN